MKLLDTSVGIDHLRGAQPAVDLLRRLIDDEEPVLASEVVRFELLAGVKDDEVEPLERFFSALSWV
ncbi:MAG: PIN domain-containing protein, partial [Steroidobacteraceae bacterium]